MAQASRSLPGPLSPWRPDKGEIKGFFRRSRHQPSRSEVPRRDDGRGQVTRFAVAIRIRPRGLDWPASSSHTPSGGGRAPTPDRSENRRRDYAKKGLTRRGPLQKRHRLVECRRCRLGLRRTRYPAPPIAARTSFTPSSLAQRAGPAMAPISQPAGSTRSVVGIPKALPAAFKSWNTCALWSE